jgi:hypothetical protein
VAVDWREYAKGVGKPARSTETRPGATRIRENEARRARRKRRLRDVTQEAIDRNKQVIATYEAILKDVRENRIKD